ncbi:MAG TPA: CdaR family protein [Candidatus Cybelea sp.]|nr:CdaR family protein [Candidatus Cybelea sp.]
MDRSLAVMELIRKNFALKLLAVALAIVGWAYFRFASNPIFADGQSEQQLSIPISTANLTLGYVAHFADREAVVTVAGKRGEPAVKPDEIKAVIDLSNKGAGVYNVPVQLVAPDLAVQSLSPASVTLTIERVEERSFPIVLHYMGQPQPSVVVNQPQIRPDVATVRAPTSVLAQIASVNANVALPEGPKAVDEMVRPVAVNASGMELTGLSVSPNLVRVQMRFVAGAAK